MSTLLTRKMIIPVWTGAVLGFFALLGQPLTPATSSILLFMALAPPTILVILSRAPTLTLSEAIAKELRPASRSRAE